MVLAQLYSKGFYCGVQAFLLPLRNHKHLPLPGEKRVVVAGGFEGSCWLLKEEGGKLERRKLEEGGWREEVGGKRLEDGGWKTEVGGRNIFVIES